MTRKIANINGIPYNLTSRQECIIWRKEIAMEVHIDSITLEIGKLNYMKDYLTIRNKGLMTAILKDNKMLLNKRN